MRNGIGVLGSLRLTACGLWFVILNFLEHRKKNNSINSIGRKHSQYLLSTVLLSIPLSPQCYPQSHVGIQLIHSYKKLLYLEMPVVNSMNRSSKMLAMSNITPGETTGMFCLSSLYQQFIIRWDSWLNFFLYKINIGILQKIGRIENKEQNPTISSCHFTITTASILGRFFPQHMWGLQT